MLMPPPTASRKSFFTHEPVNTELTTCGKAETFAKKVILALYEDGLLTWQEAQAIIDDLEVNEA